MFQTKLHDLTGTNNDKIDSDKINFLYTHESYRHFLKINLYDFFI